MHLVYNFERCNVENVIFMFLKISDTIIYYDWLITVPTWIFGNRFVYNEVVSSQVVDTYE